MKDKHSGTVANNQSDRRLDSLFRRTRCIFGSVYEQPLPRFIIDHPASGTAYDGKCNVTGFPHISNVFHKHDTHPGIPTHPPFPTKISIRDINNDLV